MPKGIYQSLFLMFPGKAIIKIEKTPKSLTPLQGSPIHTPWSNSLPIIFVTTMSLCTSNRVSNPNMFNTKLDWFPNIIEI